MFLRALFLLLAALVRLLRVHLLLLLRVAALRFLAGMTVLLVFHDRDPVDKGHAAAKCRRTVTLVPERLIAGEKAVICSRLFSCVQPERRALVVISLYVVHPGHLWKMVVTTPLQTPKSPDEPP